VAVSVVVRDHGVGVVIAAVHEEAHERLVVGVVEGRGLADGGEIDGQRSGDSHHSKLHGALQDDAASPQVVTHFCTRYSGEHRMRKQAVASMSSLALSALVAVRLKAVITACTSVSV